MLAEGKHALKHTRKFCVLLKKRNFNCVVSLLNRNAYLLAQYVAGFSLMSFLHSLNNFRYAERTISSTRVLYDVNDCVNSAFLEEVMWGY